MARMDDNGDVDFSYAQFDPTQVQYPTPIAPKPVNPNPVPGAWQGGDTGSFDAAGAWVPKSDPAPTAPAAPSGPTKPGGGNINDPAYLDSLLNYYGSQSGVNPSVKNNPDYWRQAVGSGRFNGDENYLIQRFFQPEGAPEGAGGGGSTPAPFNVPQGGDGGGGLSSFLQQWLSNQQTNQNNVNGQRAGVLSRLNGLMDQYSKPVDANDPNIKNQTDAYHGTMARQLNDFQKKAAERAYAEGVPTGAFDSQIGNATQAAGRQEGTLQSQLMSDELSSRRQNLMQALQQSGSLLSAQDSSDLQNRIAAIDATQKSQSLNLQDKLGSGQLNLGARSQDIQNALGMGSLDLQRLLGGEANANTTTSINNQNSQFYDNLGLASANSGSSNDDALLALLLGGK